MLQRPRIWQALEAGTDSAVTLVAAPPGYGKTMAVRAWCESSNSPLAWVTLDVEDNDPARLWTYVAVAVNRTREGLGGRALKRLRVAGMPIRTPVDELMNGIAAFGRELTIVLDELQTVTDRKCLASIEYAIDRLPTTARLILITRSDPALGLARLRARGALVELRADELAFTAAEARELLVERGGLQLEDEQIEVLRNRTDGWPAALYLATLWLRSVEDQNRAVLEFGGDHRYVAEYLSHELLEALDADQRSFLLRAAILGGFTTELCDHVLGRSNSAAVLADLEVSNMFVTRLERGEWFRVHPLFAEFAAARLAAGDPDGPVQIHRCAAKWLRSRRMFVEAISHASAAGDNELVAELLSECHPAMLRNGRAGALLRWARTLPDECLMGHPELVGATAIAATTVGQLTLERRRLMQLASRAKTEHPERFAPATDAMLAMVRADGIDSGIGDAVREARVAVELAERDASDLLVAALATLARALYLAGQLDKAWSAAMRSVEHPDAARWCHSYAFAHATLALIATDRGRVTSARSHAERARAISGSITSSRSWLGANTAVASGVMLAAEGELAGAERDLVHAERFFQDEVATIDHARALVRLADVRGRRGRLDEADHTLQCARDEIAELADSGTAPALAADVAKHLDEARRQASNGNVPEPPSEAELAVLRLLSTNLSAREIGGKLFLSPNTVRSHTRAIYRKLSVRSREAAVARANALGLVEATSSPM